jgi:hypothetical protein
VGGLKSEPAAVVMPAWIRVRKSTSERRAVASGAEALLLLQDFLYGLKQAAEKLGTG